MFEVMYIYMKAQIDALIDKFTNYSSCIVYQKTADGITVTTVGTNTYVNNKVNVPLTEFEAEGSLSVDTENGWILHTGATKKYNFNAVATASDPGDNNTKIYFVIFKNGTTEQDQTTSFLKIETQTGAGTLNAASAIIMNDGDYIEIYTKTDKLNGSFKIDNTQLQLTECARIVF